MGLGLGGEADTGGPGKAQRSGFAGERRSDRMSETCRLRQGEGYGVRDDEAPAPAAPDMGGMY